MKTFRPLALATVLAFTTCAAGVAQKPSSGPASTVVYVSGNDLVLKAADGKLLNYTVAGGTMFVAGGKSVPLAELKPGTKLTKEVSTGFDPQIISAVQVVKGKVFAATPPDGVTLSLADGIKELVVPEGTKFVVGGAPMTLDTLKPDMMIDATIVTTLADDAKPEAIAAAKPAAPALSGALLIAKTGGDAALPEAGTNLPLFGLLGAFLVLAGGLLFAGYRPKRYA